MKISVIIPVYNVELYLSQCLNSVISQKYEDLEIILIDDGSTDSSGHICDEYANKDQRIIVIHQSNLGVSAARNKGIEVAKGAYITFVDSDDWLEPEMYEEMIDKVNNVSYTNVIMCDTALVKNGLRIITSEFIREGNYDKKNIITGLYPSLLVTEDFGKIPIVSACSCLMLRSLIMDNHIRFDKSLKFSEDYLFMADLIVNANSFYYLKGKYFYNYRQYETSRSKKFQDVWWSTLIDLNKKLSTLLLDRKDFDFSRQLYLQLVHSSLFVSGSIVKAKGLKIITKYQLLKKILNHHDLVFAFSKLTFEKQSFGQKIVLFLMKYRMIISYLVYVNMISLIKR